MEKTPAVIAVALLAHLVQPAGADVVQNLTGNFSSTPPAPPLAAPAQPATAPASTAELSAPEQTAALKELNGDNAVAAAAEARAIIAAKEKYARDMLEYRRKVAADAAAAAVETVRFEDEMARYRAEKARSDAAMADYLRRYPKVKAK